MIQNFVAKLSAKEKKIFYVALAIVLIAIFDRLFLGPVISRLQSLDEDIRKEETAIRSDLRFLSYKDKILKENEVLSRYYTTEIKTEEEIIADFLKRIEMLATEAEINLIKVSPADVKVKKGYVEYYATLESDGKLNNVVQFMHSIDTSDDLLKIVKLNVTPKRANPEEVGLTMTIMRILVDYAPVREAMELVDGIGSGALSGSGEGAAGVSGGGAGGSGTEKEGGKTTPGFAGGSGVGSKGSTEVGSGDGYDATVAGGGSGSSDSASNKKEKAKKRQVLFKRFGMKGSEKKEKDLKEEEEEEVYEIKPSPFERFIGGGGLKALFSKGEEKKE